MRARVKTLGAIPPGLRNDLNAQVSRLEALQQQVLSDVILTGRQGADVSQHQVRVNAMTDEISVLKAQIATADEDVVPQLQSSAAAIEARAIAQLKELADLRQSTANAGTVSGLKWGLGAAIVVAVGGYWVWKYKKKSKH